MEGPGTQANLRFGVIAIMRRTISGKMRLGMAEREKLASYWIPMR